MIRSLVTLVCLGVVLISLDAQKYTGPSGRIRVALAKQPFSPNGLAKGPATMAEGGIQKILADLGADIRIQEARLTPEEDKEYGGWKRLGMALGHFSELVAQNEREGYFTVGLLATCPSMPGLVAGLQRSGEPLAPLTPPASSSSPSTIFGKQPRPSSSSSIAWRSPPRPSG